MGGERGGGGACGPHRLCWPRLVHVPPPPPPRPHGQGPRPCMRPARPGIYPPPRSAWWPCWRAWWWSLTRQMSTSWAGPAGTGWPWSAQVGDPRGDTPTPPPLPPPGPTDGHTLAHPSQSSHTHLPVRTSPPPLAVACGSPRELAVTTLHESMHLFGLDHCTKWCVCGCAALPRTRARGGRKRAPQTPRNCPPTPTHTCTLAHTRTPHCAFLLGCAS